MKTRRCRVIGVLVLLVLFLTGCSGKTEYWYGLFETEAFVIIHAPETKTLSVISFPLFLVDAQRRQIQELGEGSATRMEALESLVGAPAFGYLTGSDAELEQIRYIFDALAVETAAGGARSENKRINAFVSEISVLSKTTMPATLEALAGPDVKTLIRKVARQKPTRTALYDVGTFIGSIEERTDWMQLYAWLSTWIQQVADTPGKGIYD